MKAIFTYHGVVLAFALVLGSFAGSAGSADAGPPAKTIVASRFDRVAINPQPLPPRVLFSSYFRPGVAVSLNPQPLPPKEIFRSQSSVFRVVRLGSVVSLNPQPLPPEPPVHLPAFLIRR